MTLSDLERQEAGGILN